MNCCDGNCNQGRDCPVRKQRTKEVNDAYINGLKDSQIDDPYEDIAYTFKGLITLLMVVLCVWIVCLLIWGK